MMETTGLYMMKMAGMGHAYYYPWKLMVMAIIGKVVVSFLFVWLCVYLMSRLGLAPFHKKK